jgi:hypothetical protein
MNQAGISGRLRAAARPGASPAALPPTDAFRVASAGAPPPTYSPSLDFQDTRNSQYAVIVSGFI